MQSKERSRKIN